MKEKDFPPGNHGKEAQEDFYGSGGDGNALGLTRDNPLLAAHLHVERKEMDDAARVLNQHLEREPDDAAALGLLGSVHTQMGDHAAALACHQKLAEISPEDDMAMNAAGMNLVMLNRMAEALPYLEKAVALAPENPMHQGNLGKVLLASGQPAAALAHLETAAQLKGVPDQNLMGALSAAQKALQMEPEQSPAQPQAGHSDQDPSPAPPLPRPQAAASPKPPEPPRQPEPEPEPSQVAAPAAPRPLPRPQALAQTARPLNVLFVQQAPCIRNYKMATALTARGHRVSLAYGNARLSDMYPGLSDDTYAENIRLSGHRHLWDISGDYDLVHCHNEPDVLSVVALGGAAPVVHDTHDLISLRAGGDANLSFFEGLANRAAAGRVYTTSYQRDKVRELYGLAGPSLVFHNYVSAADLPGAWLPKLSQSQGGVHLVYEGGIGGRAHRDFLGVFTALAEAGLNIHIYPSRDNQQLNQAFAAWPGIKVHRSRSPREIIGEMSQYDFGLIPWNLEQGNREFLDTTIANKLFEYQAAGLPVATSPLKSYVDYFAENPVGLTFENPGELVERLDELAAMTREVDFSQRVFTYESQVTRLEEFYYRVMEGHGRRKPAPAEPSLAVAAPAFPAEDPIPAPSAEPAPAAPAEPSLAVTAPAFPAEDPIPAPSAEPAPAATAEPSLAVTAPAFPAEDPIPAPTAEPEAHPLLAPLAESTGRLLDWLAGNGWAGYDPYDVKAVVMILGITGKISQEQAREVLRKDLADPGGARRELGIKPAVNAKAMGLVLSSLVLLEDSLKRDFADWKSELADWLMNNTSPNMSGLCWGYPFDWESVVVIPAGTPTGVISYHVGDAFWLLHQKTGQQKWLDACLSIGHFMANDLNQDRIDRDALCFSYTPLDFYHVHNANLTVAEWLARLGREAGIEPWIELAEKALNFALRDLGRAGFLTYWARGYEPSPDNVGQVDHYHAAAELRALYRLTRRLPQRQDLARAFENYLAHYLANFFAEDGLPKIHPQAAYPVDIHAAAEAAYILGEVMADHPAAAQTAERFVPWMLANCQNPDGSFIYRIYQTPAGPHTERFPFLRWGQAWSLRGLASLLAGFSGQRQGGLK